MRQSLVLLLAVWGLTACVPNFGAKDQPQPIMGAQIDVSALPALGAAIPSESEGSAQAIGVAQNATAPTSDEKPGRVTGASDATPPPVSPTAPQNAATEGGDLPPQTVPKSAAQLKCEAGKGLWNKVASGVYACVKITKDGQKSCKSARQCEGQCLARSMTCAPFEPLFGCNEILDDMGRVMRQCLN